MSIILPKRSSIFYPAQAGADLFTGGIDYMTRTTGLGASDGATGTLSFWYKRSSASNQSPVFLACETANNSGVKVYNSGTAINLLLTDGAASPKSFFLSGTTTGLLPKDDVWRHVLMSWDTNFPAASKVCLVCVNEVFSSFLASDANTAFNMPYSASNWGISNTIVRTSSAYIDGGVSEYWFNNSFLDITILANRRKFISATRRPVFLGSNGSKPTGSQPLIYLKGSGTGFDINYGSGGNFTTTGTLTTPTTTPST